MNIHRGIYHSGRSDLPFFSEAYSKPFVDSSSAPSALDLRKEDLIRENLHLRKGDLAQGQSVAEVRNCLRARCHRRSCRCLSPPFVPVLVAALRAGARRRRHGVVAVSPTPSAKKTKRKRYFPPAITAMAPPFETRHATAIRWRFFKKPPHLSAMALPWPVFNNTDYYHWYLQCCNLATHH